MFTLRIDTDNDAFREDEGREVGIILQQAADKVLTGSLYGNLVDTNGNTVGEFDLRTDPMRVGTARFTDDSGLDWLQVIVSNEHGDAVFQVIPDRGEKSQALADALADELLVVFEVLGLAAERGEPDRP